MQTVVLTIHLILALMLIALVLMQRSEGGGLGIGGGPQASGRQGGSAMTRATWIIAAAFIVTSITLTIFATQESSGRSVIDGAVTAPAGNYDNTLVPNTLGEDLLPPSPTDEPAAPPRAE